MRKSLSNLTTIGVVCVLYFIIGKLGSWLAAVDPNATVVWPPTGFALAAVLLLGQRVWPAILCGDVLLNVTSIGSFETSLGIAAGNTVEALVGAWLASRFANGGSAFDRASDVVKFVALAGLTSTVIGATFGVTSLSLGGFARWDDYLVLWATWSLGHLTSNLVIAPLILVWTVTPLPHWQPRSAIDAVFLSLPVLVVGQMVFGAWVSSDSKSDPIVFLCILPLFLAALRFGQHGAVTATYAMAASAIWGTLHGFGPFALADANELIFLLQTFLATIAGATLVLTAVLSEHKRTEELFHLVVESVPNGLMMIDHNGLVVLANPQMERMFGYSSQELLGQPVETLIVGGYRDQHLGHREEFFTDPKVRSMGAGRDLFGLRKDGSEFPVEIGLNPINTPEGAQVLASVIDITERRAYESRLQHSEERFRSMIENVKDHAIYMLDPEGRVLTWNQGAQRTRGYRDHEIIGKPYDELFPAEDRAAGRAQELLATALAEGQCETEGWRARKDGSKFWASTIITAVRDAHGKLIGFSNVTRDLTRWKRIEDELTLAKEEADAANQAKSDFLANISHEIRTPMAGVIGMSGLLCDTELTAKQREYCEIIRGSGESLLTIINELLDFSKIESGMLELEIIDFDLRSAMKEFVELFVREADDKGIELINFIHPDVPANLRGDPGRLRQILSNLVGNALKFTTKGEVAVWVEVVEQNQNSINLRFAVNDTGIGIAKDKIDKLFNAFTQADSSITRKYGGTGLGLAISKKFVDLMGGQIGVSSEEGRGSSFWFTVELEKGHLTEPARQIHVELSRMRMLIVDDSSTHRALLESYLSSLGIASQSAADATFALKLLRASAQRGELPDLVLLDSSLPGTNAPEWARAIRRENGLSRLKLLLMTTASQRFDLGVYDNGGIDGFLTKPIGLAPLIECLAVVTGKAPKVDASTAIPSRHSRPALAARQPLRILVADDNYINQKVAVSLLENLGHRADVVANGHEAIEAYRLVPYDMILMDVQMPEMDGLETSRKIRALEKTKNRHTPIIAMTAHARKEDQEKCLAAGMDDYVSKPVNPRELKAAIARRTAASMTIPPIEPPTLAPAHAEVLNFSHALELVDGNRELLCEVARIFLNQYPKALAETRRALAQEDYQTLTSTAHNLVSSVGQLGGQRAVAAARKLELISSDGDRSQVPAVLAELERELLWLKSAMSNPAYFRLPPAEALH
ncbi:MAG: PAS domain S-box protein [Candidatus Binatia bacterium]